MIKIVTDSTAGLPEAMIREHDIRIVPLYLHFGEQAYREGVDISNAQFYTPLLFEAFWGVTDRRLGFARDLRLYSYRQGRAKPSPALFELARARLRRRGIERELADVNAAAREMAAELGRIGADSLVEGSPCRS